jgi:hypothetical protein
MQRSRQYFVIYSLIMMISLAFSVTIEANHTERQGSLLPTPGVFALGGYYGFMTDQPLGQVLLGNIDSARAELYSVEGEYQFANVNPVTWFFKPIANDAGMAFNLTFQRDPKKDIYQMNPYLFIRWDSFPWNYLLPTSLTFGEGLSYATSIPMRELKDKSSHNAKRFLNLLMFEAAFSMPSYHKWQVFGKLHHRSGAFGLYGARNTGSTAAGVGIRYRWQS